MFLEKHLTSPRSWHHQGVWSMQIPRPAPRGCRTGLGGIPGVFCNKVLLARRRAAPETLGPASEGGAENVGKWGQPFSVRRGWGQAGAPAGAHRHRVEDSWRFTVLSLSSQ